MEISSLYDLADKFYRIEPWTWVGEEQLVGLRHPESGEMGYASVMGASGIHRTVAVYLGEEALHRFNLIQKAAWEAEGLAQEDVVPLILESRQLQVSFARRDELFASELAEIQRLGRRYRGEKWPTFRSFRPGFSPARAEGAELDWLRWAMEQILAVAPGFRGNPYGDRGKSGAEMIVRERIDGEWRTAWMPRDERLHEFPTPAADPALLAQVAALPAGSEVECQLDLIPAPIGEEGRGTFPYVVMSVDSRSGAVLGVEVLSVETCRHDELIASVPSHFLRQWLRAGWRPSKIWVATAKTEALLKNSAAALKIPVKKTARLPALARASQSLRAFLEAGEMPF